MKILTVIDNIGSPAWGVDGIYRLQCELSRLGLDVHILTLINFLTPPNWKEWMQEESRKTGITFHYIDRAIFKRSTRFGTPESRIAYFFKVMRLNRKYKFDIIHEYSSAPLLCYRTAMYKLFSSVKTFHTICAYNTSFLCSLRFWRGIKFVDQAICLASEMRDELIRRGCPSNKVTYLPYGVDCSQFDKSQSTSEIRDRLGLPADKRIILYVGPIEAHKGVFVLAEAANEVLANYPDVIFVLACKRRVSQREHACNKRRLNEIIARAQDRVRIFEGLVDIPSFMKMADIFVLPLIIPHGTMAQPLTLLEAMAAGKATVAPDIAGSRELIIDSESGLLFEAGNSSALAQALIKLLHSEELRSNLGQRAANEVIEKYDIPLVAQKLKEWYENATKG